MEDAECGPPAITPEVFQRVENIADDMTLTIVLGREYVA